VLGDEPHADGRREMIDLVGVGGEPADQRLVGHRALRIRQPLVAQHGGEVFHAARRFVIDDRHAVAARQQGLDQMAADESRPARYQTMPHDERRAEWAKPDIFDHQKRMQ